jgi:AAHS family 4-hydroxybenzoate transporter-like MFS transporter
MATPMDAAVNAAAGTTINADAVMNQSRIGRLQILVAVLTGFVLFVDGFDTQAIAFVAPQLTRLWHIPHDLLGYMFSSGLVGLMIGYLGISPLSGRFGQRRVIIGCVASFGLLTVLTATATGPWSMMAYRLLTGIGLGGAIPAAVSLCGEYCPQRRRSTFITFMYCGYSLGTVAAGVVSVVLVEAHGWQSVLLFAGIVPTAHAIIMWFLLPDSLEFMITKNRPRAAITGILHRIEPGLIIKAADCIELPAANALGAAVNQLFQQGRGFGTLMIWLALFMNLMILFFAQNWLPSIFVEIGFTQDAAINATSVALAGGLGAALVMGPLMDRFGPYTVMAGLFCAGGVSVGLIGVADMFAQALMVVAAICAGFCLSGIQKCTNALAVYFYPTSLRATGLGWGLGIGRAGAIIGPSAAGLMLTAGLGTASLFYASILPMFVGASAIFRMGRYYAGGKTRDVRKESVLF